MGDVVYAASLAGEVRGGVTITNVVNYGDVNIPQDAESGAKGDYLGGICAYFLADSDSQMTGCRNYGDLTYSSKAAGTVYCGGIGGGAQNALAQAGIKLFGGVMGNADEAVKAYLNGTLNYNANVQCNHHGHGHSCSGHGHACHEDKHGCSGN